jgi:hypothetical protein
MADKTFALLPAVAAAAFVAVATVSAGERCNAAASPTQSAEMDWHETAQTAPVGSQWPCRLVVSEELLPFVRRAWDLSATFRDQCLMLAAARAVVILHPMPARDVSRAEGRISVTPEGLIVGRMRVRRGSRSVELIAHELEHVLERVEGFKFLMEARRGRAGVMLIAGAFETRRAIDAGKRVAREVEGAERARQ